MSKQQFDSDGFQIVRTKRSSKNKQTKIPPKDSNFREQEVFLDIGKSTKRINSAADDLRASDYLKHVIDSVSTVLSRSELETIVCFGLGHIGDCTLSRYQLALLLCLKDTFNCSKILVHDPVFYKSECTILTKLGLQVLPENSEGGYVISKRDITLMYLPHCPKQLTNNFLWSNWSTNLENCILLCNSFSSLIENQPNRILNETVPYICKISPYVSEIALENNFVYSDIFNDTAIHHFPKEKLESIDSEFWTKGVTMASITSKPVLKTLRGLLSELRKQGSTKKLSENQMARYILDQYRQHQTTDQQLCKAIDEMHFKAKSYYDYLHNTRKYKEINAEFKGKGERSTEETARMVGFKLPHDPKP